MLSPDAHRINWESFLAFLIFFFAIYSFWIKAFLGITFLDDFISILLFLTSILFISSNTVLKKKLLLSAGLLLVTFFIGIISSLVFKYQNLSSSLLGSIIYFKSFLPSFFVIIVLKNKIYLDTVYFKKSLWLQMVFSIVIFCALNVMQLILGRETDYISGLPRLFAMMEPKAAYGMCLMFLILIYSYSSEKLSNIIFIIIAILLILSFRVKAFIFLAIVIAFHRTQSRVFSLKNLSLLIISALLTLSIPSVRELIYQKIMVNISYDDLTEATARLAMHITSIEIAYDHFPLGAGYSTFGSSFSASPYSILYSDYGLSHIYGLSENYPNYIADTQLSPMFAELGFFGLLTYISGISLFISAHRKNASSIKTRNAIILAIFFLLISITSVPILFQSMSAGIFLLVSSLGITSNDTNQSI